MAPPVTSTTDISHAAEIDAPQESATEAQHDDRRARRAVWLLVWAQAVLGSQMPVHFILGGLAGQLIAPNPAYATMPISIIVMGSMCSAPVISWIMGRWGRRTGFLIGALAGTAGAAVVAEAIIAKDFPMMLAGCFLTGTYMAAHNFYRFAAADMASPAFRAKAISWVMAGGLLSALIGPELVIWTRDLLAPVPFAGAYRAVIVLNIVGALPLFFLDIPRPPRAPKGQRNGRAWGEILADRRVPVAIFCAMVAYALMNLVMTSTPLAMIACGFGEDDAASVVRVHVLAMFAPSFFTGALIARFGAPRIIALGLTLLGGCAAVSLTGVEIHHFYAGLALLGVGWNFAFIGATTMLAGAHRPEERARVQGLNDFLVFGLVTVGSFSSGALMDAFGWEAVNIAMAPAIFLAATALMWLAASRRRA